MQQQKNQEQRQLGLAAAMAVVTGESIALGIFLTPAAMAKSLGSPLLLGLVWLGVALMAMCGALSYSELAIRFPDLEESTSICGRGMESKLRSSMAGRVPSLCIREWPLRWPWGPRRMWPSCCRRPRSTAGRGRRAWLLFLLCFFACSGY